MLLRLSVPCATLLLAQPLVSLAQPPAEGRAAPASTSAEIARLEQEVRDLRQMLIQAIQVEQQHYDLLLKLLQSAPGAATSPGAALPAPGLKTAAAPARPATERTGTIAGTVEIKGTATSQPVYVFVENLRAPAARGRTEQIVQKDKQFSPQISVVPWGTTVYFPNGDRVAHNVFSLSKRSTFDLGILKAGERGTPVVLREPGVVEVYCDIHERMRADVLVVPNGYFVKAGPDGKYRLPNVPTGERVIAAWTAGGEPVKRSVRLDAEGVEANFTLTVSPRSHNNKLGQPYGSYGE
jgi:plastocyanin